MSKPSLKGRRVNVIMPEQQIRIAQFLAARRGTTFSEIVRQAVAKYLNEELLLEKAVEGKIKELGLPDE